jgi:hypothetical protein
MYDNIAGAVNIFLTTKKAMGFINHKQTPNQ